MASAQFQAGQLKACMEHVRVKYYCFRCSRRWGEFLFAVAIDGAGAVVSWRGAGLAILGLVTGACERWRWMLVVNPVATGEAEETWLVGAQVGC